VNAARVEETILANRRTTIPGSSLASEFSIGTVQSTVCEETQGSGFNG